MKVLNQAGFDQWAKDYDNSVKKSKDDNTYPFAGYDKLISFISETIDENQSVLDLGIGTGMLSIKLIEKGCSVTGVDFSLEMLKLAKDNAPEVTLIKHDLNKGLPELNQTFDAIASTYAFHHFDLEKKVAIIHQAMKYLEPGHKLYIGDVSFDTRFHFLRCREENLSIWDDSEQYFVFEEIQDYLYNYKPEYIKVSFCSGILILTKPIVNKDDQSKIEISL